MRLALAALPLVLAACGDNVTNIIQAPAAGSGGAGVGMASSAEASSSAGAGGHGGAAQASSVSTVASSSESSATAGSGGAGGIVPPECVVPGDCPGVDNECRSRTCSAGKCGVSFVPAGTPLAVQVPGDCATAVCDGTGAMTTQDAPADVEDDGLECTVDACPGPTHTPKAQGTSCLSTCGCPPCGGDPLQNPDCVFGLCNAGACVGYIPVKCKIGNTTYTGCDGFSHPGVLVSFPSGFCYGTKSETGYCAPGDQCGASVNGTFQGAGTCQ